MQTLREKSLEPRQFLNDVPAKDAKSESNFHVLGGSLIERYKRNDVGWHIHFRSAPEGSINNREGSDFCALLQHGIKVETPVELSVNLLGDEVVGGLPAIHDSGQYPPMLVDIAELVHHGEHINARILPAVVRLQSLDFCNRVNGNPIQPPASELLLKRFWRRTDREHIVSGGIILRSKYKFPYQIIETGAQVLEKITHDAGNTRRDGGATNNLPDKFIRVSVFLSHHFCGILLKEPACFGSEFFEMFLCPEELPAN